MSKPKAPDFVVFPRMREAFPLGQLVQLKPNLGRCGRSRVGNVTGWLTSKVLVTFLTDPDHALPCTATCLNGMSYDSNHKSGTVIQPRLKSRRTVLGFGGTGESAV